MNSSPEMLWTIITSTMVITLFIGFIVLLLVLNNTRRIRHRAELAEADRRRDQEVMNAEREATQHTLREVGRELHDNVAQLLTVAQMGMNSAVDSLGSDTRLVAARDALDQGIEEVRRLGHDLNSDLWQHRSLADAISAEADRIERVGRVQCHVLVKGVVSHLAPDTSTILFRVFQEVVNNALKHSKADTITITLDATRDLSITIADNGRGFDAQQTRANGGFVNIHRRCALIGYEADCAAETGKGCTWTLTPARTHGA
ncbi:MAG: hypothetical protein IPO90_13200 [Flavobacteriales bacterium]|nr:hypothetical protein [Flavobacteriales bacterium]